MTDLTPYEISWVDVLDELRNSPAIQVHGDFQGPVSQLDESASKAFAELAQWEGITLDPALHQCYLRFASISSHWETEESRPPIAGEFDLTHLYEAVVHAPPELGWPDQTPVERSLLSELRGFDGTSRTGVGHLAALRIQQGIENPEIWFDSGPLGHYRMDVNYCEYLEALRMTKGTFGWQYLFTEAPLAADDFNDTKIRLQNMLNVFPEIFPGHEYSLLRDRLEARL